MKVVATDIAETPLPDKAATSRALVLDCHRSAIRARLAKSDRRRAGQGSVSWKLNREIIVVAGWGRAILLQLAHPAVGAGVSEHSAFRGCPVTGFKRLRSTVRAMLALTFGNTEEMISTAAGINVIHDRVRGRSADGNGEVYSAHDPALQQWVHATLLESIPQTYELLVGPLTPRERDRYCSEAAIMEPLLGITAGRLPRNAAELDEYMKEMLDSGQLVVSDSSRKLARAILYPRKWQLLWPVFRPMQLLTIGSLPPTIREAYGFHWRSRDARAFARWTTMLRVVWRLLPRFAREWPVARRTMHKNARHIGVDCVQSHRA
jgi:uncharacterized protein (DUF2236 family)